MLLSSQGASSSACTPTRSQSRYGSGVRVMRLGENDKVMVLARTDHDDEAQTETIEAEEGEEPTAEQLAAMEAADEASAAEAPEADTPEE